MAKRCPTCGKTFEDKKAFCPDDMSTLVSSGEDETLVGTVIADRYLITEKIGEGGMGRVYKAQHVLLEKRQAAIKVLHPALLHDSDALTRFKREASNTSSINNSHVAQVYDFGEAGEGLVYLAIEFVPGETLSKLLAREGPLEPMRTANLVRQIAEGLDAAHKLGIVHRDLKPDNILVTKEADGDECVKVVDFGIAKAIEGEGQRVTKTGFVTGTLEYMSPEQITGSDVDARSDVYALALVACEMLTGRLPFVAERAEQAMMMRLSENPKPLSFLMPSGQWPAELQPVLDRALARDPANRFPGAGAFARALALSVGDMDALPPTMVRRDAAPTERMAPAPADANTLPQTRVAQSNGKSGGRGPLPYLIGATSVVVIAIGAVVAMRRRGEDRVPVTPRDSTVTAPPVGPKLETTATISPRPPVTDTAQLSRPVPPPPARDSVRTPAPVPGTGPLVVNYRALMDSVEKALDPATASAGDARAAIPFLARMMPHLSDKDERVRAQLLRVEALMLSDQGARACPVLSSITGNVSDGQRKRIDLYRSELKCP